MMEGFIKLNRKILDWEWYTDINTCHLFIHCLISANHADKKWKGVLVKRGSFITSYSNLAKETGLSIQNIRTSLNKLKSTQCITQSSRSKYTIITVFNYDLYQSVNTMTNNQLTNNQQTTNKQLTTNKNEKNIKNEKNKRERQEREKSGAPETMGFTAPTPEPTLSDVVDFVKEKKLGFDAENFYWYYKANGWTVGGNPMRDWKAMAMRWSKTEYKNEQAVQQLPEWYKCVNQTKPSDRALNEALELQKKIGG